MKQFESKSKQGYIKGRVFDSVEEINDHEQFMLVDLYGPFTELNLSEKIVVVDSVFVSKEFRRQGYGTKLMQDIINEHKNDLIILSAGALTVEYPDDLSDEEYDRLFEILKVFYVDKLNFMDVNKYIGCYEYKITYIYNNEVGNKVLQWYKDKNPHIK